VVKKLSACSSDASKGKYHKRNVADSAQSYLFFLKLFPADTEYDRSYRTVEIDGPDVPCNPDFF
jgi:hypothetical protein